MNEIKTVYITNYWESKGIFAIECEMVPEMRGQFEYAKGIGTFSNLFCGPKDYSETWEGAHIQVSKKAEKKIESLERKIKNIKNKWL